MTSELRSVASITYAGMSLWPVKTSTELILQKLVLNETTHASDRGILWLLLISGREALSADKNCNIAGDQHAAAFARSIAAVERLLLLEHTATAAAIPLRSTVTGSLRRQMNNKLGMEPDL